MRYPIHRYLKAICFLAIVCLVLSGCIWQESESEANEVGADGGSVTSSGVTITFPRGAVPEGTVVEASFDERAQPELDPDQGVRLLTDAFSITLEDGIQPDAPLTVEIPIDPANFTPESQPEHTLALLIQSEGSATPDLVPAQWNEAETSLIADVPHLSWIWPIQIDFGAITRSVRDTVLQSFRIEHPEPECVGDSPTVGQTSYTVVSPAQSWVCVLEEDGALTVEASPNSPIPFLVGSAPSATTSMPTEVSLASAISVAVANSLRLFDAGEAIVMPGTTAKFSFDGEPDAVTLSFEQYPVMLLLSILATTFDTILGAWGQVPALDRIGDAECICQTP